MGRLGKDVGVKSTSSGLQIANFSVAYSEKVKGESVTTWFNVVCFDKQAEIASKYLSRGSQVLIEGKIQIKSYDKKDGTKGQSIDVIASNIVFLSAKEKDEQLPLAAVKQAFPKAKIEASQEYTADEIPF